MDIRIAEALEEHPDSDNVIAAVVTMTSPKTLLATLQSGEQITITADGLKAIGNALTDEAWPKHQIRRGAIIRVVLDKQKEAWSVVQMPEVEGAFVSEWTHVPA